MKQTFTILWIEDNEKVITSQEPAIKKYLEHEGFDLRLLKDTDGDTYESYLDNESIDIIVTDYNISEDVKGTDVIKNVRNRKLLTDILFYSVMDQIFKKEDIYTQLGHYGLIDICIGKEITDPLIEIIKKNLLRCQDIVFLRGFVISRSVELELQINFFLSNYFKINESQRKEFHDFILESSYVPFAGKKKWMSLILEKNNLKTDVEFKGLLNQLDNIVNCRNLLAHCKKSEEDCRVLCSSGKETKFDKEKLKNLLIKINTVEKQLEKLTKKFPN
jgi:CheY-like chemotaxis protein